MLWSSRTNDGFPPLGLNCSDTLWSRHLQENIYSIPNHDNDRHILLFNHISVHFTSSHQLYNRRLDPTVAGVESVDNRDKQRSPSSQETSCKWKT